MVWQEYTKELYKQDLHDPENHDGVITYLEPDILKCDIKLALVSITMNKANMPAHFENSIVATGLEKISFHYNSKERQSQRMLKLPNNCTHITRL